MADNSEFHQTTTIETFAEEFTLLETHYDYYTGSGKLEAILIYDTNNTPYYGNTLLLLFDVESCDLLLYQGFPKQDADVYLLENDHGSVGYVLFMGVSWHQGIPNAQTELASLENGEWNSLPIPREDEDVSLRYTYNEAKRELSVQAFEYVFEDDSEYPLVINIGEALVYNWSSSLGLFEITSE